MTTRCGHHGFTWLYLGAILFSLFSLLAVSQALAAQLTLTWTDNASDELGFRIERRLSPSGTYSEITTVGPNVTSYADTTVTGGQAYCYHVRAYNAAGDSSFSNEACGTATAPTSVTLSVVKAGSGAGTVTSTTPTNAINCGVDCAETVVSGTPITLTASAGSGSVFSGWSGGGCSGTGNCTTPMAASATVTATFNTASAPPGGLVAAYSFDQGSGSTVPDASGQGNTGTISGATWTTQGRFGGALSFDGSNDYVTLGNPAALQLTGSMTVSAWINSSAFPFDDAAIVSKRASGQLGVQLDTTVDQGTRAVGFKLTNASGGSMFRYGATTLQLNTWYHVAGVYNASTQALDVYLNGQLDNAVLVGTITSSQQDSTQNVHIGQRPGIPGDFNLAGRIDEVRIYNRPLSSSEITAIVNVGLGGGTPPPPSFTLTANKTGTGTGTVTGTQGGSTVINCGADCSESVDSGTTVALTATPASDSTFTGWSGACSGTGACSPTVTAATAVTATFAKKAFALTVSKAGAGSGTVAGTQGSTTVITCGSDCAETVDSGTTVALTATPAADSTFTGWSGACSGTGACSPTVTTATAVTATFALVPSATVQFSLANYSVSESAATATITVVRSVLTTTQVQVHYEAGDGTAVAGTDYTVVEGDLVFQPGQTSQTFSVPITNTAFVDGARTVLLHLSSPQNAQLGAQATAVLTIQDDDGGGTLSFSATGYAYPDKQGYATIGVTRSGGTAGGVSVKYRTGAAGTAVAGVDYTAITSPQTLTFGPNETSKTFNVNSLGNSIAGDANKTVQLILSDPFGGATLSTPNVAMLTLTNDDSGGGIRFAASSYSVPETAGKATLTVTRSGGVASGVSVQITAVDGSAKAGVDYGGPTPATLTFAAGETSKTVEVSLLANPLAATSRSLTVKLQNPGGGGTLSTPSTATVTLTKVGIRFSQPTYTVNEGPGSATITVNRMGTAKGVTVQVETLDDSAVAPADYTAIIPPRTLSFSKNETFKSFTVAIANNPNKLTNRALRLRLLNAVGEPLGEPHESTLLILDKDRTGLQLTAFAPPATGLAGKTISVPNDVRNLSARSAPASSVKFVLAGGGGPDVVLGTRSVGKLAAGATSTTTTTLTIPGETVPGSYTLTATIISTDPSLQQDTGNNVASAPLTVFSNVVRAFGVSGVLNTDGCMSTPRNGTAVTLGSLSLSGQTGGSVNGTLTLTFPLSSGLETSGPIQASVDTAGHISGTFSYTTRQGSTTLSSGTGTVTGTISDAALEVDISGQSASGETCDFAGWLAAPATPIGFMGFHHDATVGALEALDGTFVASPAFPASITRYRVLFEVAGDNAPFPAPFAVLFTGPSGSQLTDTGGAELAQLATNAAEYRSPWITSPPTAPAGAWTEEYKRTYYDYTTADPQAAGRLVVPVPSFVQANNQITRVDWQYRGATGNVLSGPPAFMRQIRLQLWDACGGSLHDSLALDPVTTSRTLSPSVALTDLAEVRFQYVDDWGNVFTVRYGGAQPGNCKFVEFSAPGFSAAENVNTASITIRREGDLTGSVAINFTTSDGTAHQGQDYTNAGQAVTLGPNVSSMVIGVPILDNETPQGPRTVLLGLNGASGGATLGPLSTAVLTINDDDPRVRFSSASYTASESSSTAIITVQRTGATAPVVSVPYSTSGGTALEGFDYTATSGVLTFASGQTSKTFTVPIVNDTLAEGGQTVNLSLGTPTGALLTTPSTAVLTITDNDAGGSVAFASSNFSVSENGGSATITVIRTGGTDSGVTVQYSTNNGTGVAGTDYDTRSGTLTFGAGETSKTFTVPVRVNVGSASKSVNLTLSNPSPGAALGGPATATLWIVNGS